MKAATIRSSDWRRPLTLLLLLAVTAAAGWWQVSQTAGRSRQAHDPAIGRGVALLQEGRAADAAAVLEDAVQRWPRDAEALYLLGLARYQAGELRPAAEALRRSVALRPEFVEGHRRLGRVYTVAREYSLAADSLERARSLAPEDATTLIQLGRLYLITGETDKAFQALQEAVVRPPESATAHSLLGEALRKSGQDHWSAARQAFQRSLKLDATNADAHHRLGWLALQEGKAAAALPYLREAVRLDPELAEGWYSLALAAQRAGRREEADRAFARFRRLRSQPPESGT